MSTSSPVVTIFGGAGFVGRYVARRMAKAGWRVRVVTRKPNEALFVQTYGSVGQVRPIIGNLRHEGSIRAAVRGSDAVVNCVGILAESGKQTFDAIHAEGAAMVAEIAAEEGVPALVHISSIGASQESTSRYAKSKAEGEALVLTAYPDAIILRPSIIFGTEDEFFNRFATLAKLSPVLPIFGADALMQPVYVDDVAAAVEAALTKGAASGVYELGGPEVASFNDLIIRMLRIIQRRRMIMVLPWWLASFQGKFFDLAGKMTFGLFNMPFTRDQVESMKYDNVVSDSSKNIVDLGVEATPLNAVLEGYLYPYRPSGQYAKITASAKNM